jgi:hypothetical protein
MSGLFSTSAEYDPCQRLYHMKKKLTKYGTHKIKRVSLNSSHRDVIIKKTIDYFSPSLGRHKKPTVLKKKNCIMFLALLDATNLAMLLER